MSARIALLGATGFLGSAVRQALEVDGVEVVSVTSPRLSTRLRSARELWEQAATSMAVDDIASQLSGVTALVNAAGFPDASSLDEDRLFGANSLMPLVALAAAQRADIPRVVHVSSAVVQNDKRVLDDSEEMLPFSPYSASKIVGEIGLRDNTPSHLTVTRYRPPSVHAPGRRVTRMVARIARSPLASVARPGDQPSPQAQLPNVGAAVAFLATTELVPPPVVVHPSEGVTVSTLMKDLSGGREPRRINGNLAALLVRTGKLLGRLHRPTAANARRVELLWLGQGQMVSWLTSVGWSPPVSSEGWRDLGARARESA